MSWVQERLDRLRQIVASCVKNGMYPDKAGFHFFVSGLISSSYGLTPRTVKNYIKTLIDAWKFNRWDSYLSNNGYVSHDEVEAWRQVIKR